MESVDSPHIATSHVNVTELEILVIPTNPLNSHNFSLALNHPLPRLRGDKPPLFRINRTYVGPRYLRQSKERQNQLH